MIVRTFNELIGTEREIITDHWTSRRVLLESDGMGFSLHQTIIKPKSEMHMHYEHHVEAVLCISGEGEIEVKDTSKKYRIEPGVMYALNGHERHILRAHTELTTICVFNPPVHSREVHDSNGSYPLAGQHVGEVRSAL